MVKVTRVTVVLVLITFILNSCTNPTNSKNNSSSNSLLNTDTENVEFSNDEAVIGSPDVLSTLSEVSISDSTKKETPAYPLYFPMPYYHVFAGGHVNDYYGNIDAFLHNSAVNYYSPRVDATSGHLLIPSLRLLDEWKGEGDMIYYLCFMAEYDYYNLAELLMEKEHDFDNFTGEGSDYSLGSLIRFKVMPFDENENNVSNFWGFRAVDILEEPMWGTGGGAILELSGGRPIADDLLSAMNGAINNTDIPYIRDILASEYSHNKPKLLEKYLEVYFPRLK
ncbi:MAG: hypothetical protein FWH33_03600 [Oscillospiraceae bacterium]|nr:hypothetical protein [Oscillospiraceae bacterium]